jgi:hypothetical protein
MPLKRGRRRRLDESGEGCESGGESDSKNFYFDVAEDEVLEGGSVGGKSTPTTTSPPSSSSSSSSTSTSVTTMPAKKFDFSSIAISTSEDLKLSWKDSLLDSMAFAHTEDEKETSAAASPRDEEAEFCFDLGKSSDDERCLEEIPQEMVRELTELRSYNSTLQDMIKDVQQFNSYQRKKRRQWELSKINNGGTATASAGSSLTTAAPSDALPQWLVSDFSSLSNKLVDLSSDSHTSSSSASATTTSSATHQREEGHDMDYLAAWQQSMANHGAPLQLPAQLAQLAGLQQQQQQPQSSSSSSTAPQSGPAPFTTSLPFTEV